jgi:hypothetical protein
MADFEADYSDWLVYSESRVDRSPLNDYTLLLLLSPLYRSKETS